MKKLLMALLAAGLVQAAPAATTISSVTSSNAAYGANIGWVNFYGDGANGVSLGEFICSGYAYGANVGWISFGNGSPADGIRYANAGADFGVNHDGAGVLRGYAYGANIGWINFEANGDARVDLQTGELSGYAYGANVGWIALSTFAAVVKTDSFAAGTDSDGDGIPDAWERAQAGNLTALTLTGDADGDGVSDVKEYRADTNPLLAGSNLRITSHAFTFEPGYEEHTLTFTSRPTRLYRFNIFDDLNNPAVFTTTDLFAPSAGPTTVWTVDVNGSPSQRYLRVEAVRPLAP